MADGACACHVTTCAVNGQSAPFYCLYEFSSVPGFLLRLSLLCHLYQSAAFDSSLRPQFPTLPRLQIEMDTQSTPRCHPFSSRMLPTSTMTFLFPVSPIFAINSAASRGTGLYRCRRGLPEFKHQRSKNIATIVMAERRSVMCMFAPFLQCHLPPIQLHLFAS